MWGVSYWVILQTNNTLCTCLTILDLSHHLGPLLARYSDGPPNPLECNRQTSLCVHGRQPAHRVHLRRRRTRSQASLHRRLRRNNHIPRPVLRLRPLATTQWQTGRKPYRHGEGAQRAVDDICRNWHGRIDFTKHLRYAAPSETT